MNKPEFNDANAKTKSKLHKTFGGKVVEILYGAKDENGNACAPKEGADDGHGRWYGIEVNGEYTMFSHQHSKDEGGNIEYGTSHEDHALEDMESDMLKKKDLARQSEILARDYSGDDAEEKMNALKEEWSKMEVWNTPVEKEYQARLDKALGEFEPRQEEIKKIKADKQAVIEKAEALKDATNFKEARNALSKLKDELYYLGSAGEEADKAFRSQLNKIDRTLHDKQKEYNANRDERIAAAKEKKEQIIAQLKETTKDVKSWKDASEKVNALFDEWKAAGNAGKDTDDALWEQFSSIRKEFNKARNEFFNERNAKWESSIEAKNKLIEEAKELASKNDFSREITEKMKELDKKWRAAGYSGKEKNDSLWEEFNTAKEVFWDAKKAESLKKVQGFVDKKKADLEKVKKQIEDLEYRIEIAPNPAMKEDSERELRMRQAEADRLEASIEEDEKKLAD